MNTIRLTQIEAKITELTVEYAKALPNRRKEIIKQYSDLNQEHCKLRATAYKTAKTK